MGSGISLIIGDMHCRMLGIMMGVMDFGIILMGVVRWLGGVWISLCGFGLMGIVIALMSVGGCIVIVLLRTGLVLMKVELGLSN